MRLMHDLIFKLISDGYIEKNNNIIGKSFCNKEGYLFTVKKYFLNSRNNYKRIIIEFESGFKMITSTSAVKRGSVIDRLSPTVHNKGIIGYASYKGNEREYHRWKSMIRRCYDPNSKEYARYGGKGVTVSERWLRFDLFLQDIENVDGFNRESFEDGLLELDKDAKQLNIPLHKRIYSLSTCTFLSPSENMKYAKKRENGIFISVLNTCSNEIMIYPSISSFCKEFNLDRHMVSNKINTGIEYKGFLITTGGKSYNDNEAV